MAWNPEHYTQGNYFQNETSEAFRQHFEVKPYGRILDIGCGDGQFTHNLAAHVKKGHILGIDNSSDMIDHANQYWANDKVSFEQHAIEEYPLRDAFDFVLSFWCLHWTNIDLSLPNIFNALKKGGRCYAIFSSFSDNSVLQTFHELARQGRYTEYLKERIDANNPYRTYFYRVFNILNRLPFKHVKLDVKTASVHFPDISYFKNLLLTMPFMRSFPEDLVEELMEAMAQAFQAICDRKYNGRLYYETRPIYLEAVK